ncbi:hypothetical protein ACQRIT_005606 [Beauveria bassiana]
MQRQRGRASRASSKASSLGKRSGAAPNRRVAWDVFVRWFNLSKNTDADGDLPLRRTCRCGGKRLQTPDEAMPRQPCIVYP